MPGSRRKHEARLMLCVCVVPLVIRTTRGERGVQLIKTLQVAEDRAIKLMKFAQFEPSRSKQ